MKWIFTSKQNAAVRVFNLTEGSAVKEVLRYHPLQHSLRLDCFEEQRVFFVERAGFRNHYFIFRNEYGFEAGRIYIDSANEQAGLIEFEQTSIEYTLLTDPVPEIVLYEPSGLQPLVMCQLQPENNGQDIFSLDTKEKTFGYACLVWGLSWYLQHGSVKKKFAEKAVAAVV